MTTTAHSHAKAAAADAALELAAASFAEAAERGGLIVNEGLRLWEAESARFVDEMLAQGRRTLASLCECRTPLEVLQVEQDWLKARSRSYLESGLRFADAFSRVARGAPDSIAERDAIAAAAHILG